jgi:hypothetical protein
MIKDKYQLFNISLNNIQKVLMVTLPKYYDNISHNLEVRDEKIIGIQ